MAIMEKEEGWDGGTDTEFKAQGQDLAQHLQWGSLSPAQVQVPSLPEELRIPLAQQVSGGQAGLEVMAAQDRREEEEEEDNGEEEQDGDCCSEQEFDQHRDWCRRFRKTMYYGGCDEADLPSTDRFSFSLTEICVEEFEGAVADCCKGESVSDSNFSQFKLQI